VERLDRVHDPRVKIPSPLLQQAPVRDLMRERVFESVFEIREEARLVEELGGLKVGEPATHVFFGQLGNGEQERERHVLADDRGRLEQPLVPG
jgi:hypothetical protein